MTDPDSVPPAAPGEGQAVAGLAARRLALELVQAVLVRRRPLDDAFEVAAPALAEARDRAFARALAATVLRRLGQLDALIADTLDRPLPRKAVAVRDVLRLGLAQLLFLGTPPHAAVSTSVDLVEAIGHGTFGGLVNAVLRRMGREGPARLAGQDAARLDTPEWLWDSWCDAYGEERTRAIAAAHLAEASLDLTLGPAADPADWARRLEAEILPTGSLRRPAGGSVARLPGFDDGVWWVQDAAAALPARLLANALGEAMAGATVADLCAAPGGKTAQLAAAGARVTAVDRSARRLERVTANLERLGLSAEAVTADAAAWSPSDGAPFDAVLLDAPCSATGTIRRHPDIPHLKTSEDVAKLSDLQARLLDNAVRLVRPGGTIVWCVCSLQPEEGAAQIDRLIAAGAPVERLPVTAAEIGGLAEAITPSGEVRTLPAMAADWGRTVAAPGGIDGFHIARLRRGAQP